MMSTWKLVIFALAIASVQCQPDYGEFECPRNETNHCMDGFYSDPSDCSAFYNCYWCQSYGDQCPEGYLFDYPSKECKTANITICDPAFGEPAALGSAFCVTKTCGGSGLCEIDAGSGSIQMSYNQIYVNYRDPFSIFSNNYRAYDDGLYFFHMSVGANLQNSTIDFELTGATDNAVYNMVRVQTYFDQDVLSRNVLVELPVNATVNTTLVEGSVIHSSGKEIMWAGFSLNEFMSNTTINDASFFAASDIEFTYEPEGSDIIVFERELFDNGDVYNNNTGEFTAPVDGTYFFSFTTGVLTSHRSRFTYTALADPTPTRLYELWRGNRVTADTLDTLSRCMMLDLLAGDVITVTLYSGHAISGGLPDGQDTLLSFSAFLYEPASGSKQTWSVHRPSAELNPVDPLPFFDLNSLDTNIFNTDTNRVDVTVSGIYFISLSTGVNTDLPAVNVSLVHQSGGSDVYVFSIRRNPDLGINNEPDTISRETIIHMVAGDTLRVINGQNSNSFSDVYIQTSFSGFLLHPVEDPTML